MWSSYTSKWLSCYYGNYLIERININVICSCCSKKMYHYLLISQNPEFKGARDKAVIEVCYHTILIRPPTTMRTNRLLSHNKPTHLHFQCAIIHYSFSGSPAILNSHPLSHYYRTLITEPAPLPLFFWLSAWGKFTDYLIAHAVQYNHTLKALQKYTSESFSLCNLGQILQSFSASCLVLIRKRIDTNMSGHGLWRNTEGMSLE